MKLLLVVGAFLIGSATIALMPALSAPGASTFETTSANADDDEIGHCVVTVRLTGQKSCHETQTRDQCKVYNGITTSSAWYAGEECPDSYRDPRPL